MIGTGVSRNRFVVSLPDEQMRFLEREAVSAGLGRAHVIRTALGLLEKTRRAQEIDRQALANEGPY
ncbi:MAG: hypothetical protein EOS26_10350 [Mesorhizobium sp.]|nr:MAG: hypothetical protein EOS26_10350 [Mesorhizobium sp.]